MIIYPTRWCPSSLAKLVNISPISLWFMADITIVFMGFINQLITGGHHPVYIIQICHEATCGEIPTNQNRDTGDLTIIYRDIGG